MGIAIANRKNCCDFGALRSKPLCQEPQGELEPPELLNNFLWESETVAANRVAATNPPIDPTRYGNSVSTPEAMLGLAKPNRILSEGEFQYQPRRYGHDCGCRFCGSSFQEPKVPKPEHDP